MHTLAHVGVHMPVVCMLRSAEDFGSGLKFSLKETEQGEAVWIKGIPTSRPTDLHHTTAARMHPMFKVQLLLGGGGNGELGVIVWKRSAVVKSTFYCSTS